MSIYDFSAFSRLVRTGETLEAFIWRFTDSYGKAVYSWDILPLITTADWERHIVPTLEEIVFYADTETELGIYPRGLSDIHAHVKLRSVDPAIEQRRREIIIELARRGVPVENIHAEPEGPHKTDPDEYDKYQP
jgi:hypothetical protein